MSLVGEIARAYAAPKAAMRTQLAKMTEERILLYAFLFSFLNYLARLPSLSMIAAQISDVEFAGLAMANFVTNVLMAPLVMYLIAALSHVVLRLFGGQASWREARLAIMWAALVSLPMVLGTGILKVLVADLAISVATTATGVVFLWQWAKCLQVVEFSPPKLA